MELHVTRDKTGILTDAKILNFSSDDWEVIQRSLKSSLLSEQELLEYFQNSLEDKIQSQSDLQDIEDIKGVLGIIENDITMLERLLKALDEPITTMTDTVAP